MQVRASDGTLFDDQTITVNVTDVNEAPTITSNGAGNTATLAIAESTTAVTTVTATDPDGGTTLTFSLTGGADQSLFAINATTGALSFKTAPNFEAPADSDHNNSYIVQVRASDGSLFDDQTITVNVTNVNEAPSIASNGGGDTATLSVVENTSTITTVRATDPDGGTTITFSLAGGADQSLFAINAATGALSFKTAPSFDAPADSDHNNSYIVQVRASDGSLTDDQTITVNVTQNVISGTVGNDTFIALPGNERIDAGAGIDTVTFGFKLTDATVSYVGNTAVVDGPTGHTVLTGFEKYVFTDGTVDENDGNPLVDDLYYYSHNHDVWNAHADADQHYAQFGWHEGRDPNAFFSTTFYLSMNQDVKAAGINPLVHFDAVGWKEGRQPSAAFDDAAYLAANPDVKAAGVDPLKHFLQSGASEGRQPTALTSLIASDGFDSLYYLQHNPDLQAAELDPHQHYDQYGFKEGRNPNALFDDAGYLATYTDVKNAGINPLDHYDQFGWKEGRDPSVNFDTKHYLAAYQDVANAHIDPLVHYLQNGQFEGRSAFADGVWG